ncbi:MAG: sugar phosphate isomerase/epimerase [Chloroflexi bacterium]|nr:MAG: sugar phosphate isomerase/epimerase [Chloroflexota bacterium]
MASWRFNDLAILSTGQLDEVMTQLGIGSYAFAWSIGVPGYEQPDAPMDAVGLVRRAAELGLHLVQIVDNLPLHAMTPGELNLLEREARQHDVAIEIGTRGIAPDHLRCYIDLAQRFGSPLVRVVVDTADHHPDADEIVATLGHLLPDFAAAKITLAIENHDRFKAHDLADIVARLDSEYVGICLDTVNSFGALEGPQAVLDILGPHVVNLHIKDFCIERAGHNMGFVLTGTPAGKGMLNVPWLLDCLREYGREFNAILELWPPPEATMTETVAKEMQWAVESVAYLRGVIDA